MTAAARITVWLASIAWLVPSVCACDVLMPAGGCCGTVVEADCPHSCCEATAAADTIALHAVPVGPDQPAAPGDCACAPDVETTTTVDAAVAVPAAMPVRLPLPVAESTQVPAAVSMPSRPCRVLWNVWLC